MARLDGQRFADISASMFSILKANKFDSETYIDAFTRLIGLVPNTDDAQVIADSGDLSTRTESKILENFNNTVNSGQAGQTVVDGLLKSSDENRKQLRQLIAAYVESLLSFVDRWSRLQRGQQARRLQRLVGRTFDPIVTTDTSIDLHKSVPGTDGTRTPYIDIQKTVKDINTQLKQIELTKNDRSEGILTLQSRLFELILEQVHTVIGSIPVSRLGTLGGVMVSTIKIPIAGIEEAANRINIERRAVGTELSRLQEQESLIITGVSLETGETIALKNFLQGLLYLTKSLEYKCKNCKFFEKGGQISESLVDIQRENPQQGSVCTFTFQGKTGLPTKENFSCKEVWGRINNDFWTANIEVVNQFIKEFMKVTEQSSGGQ